LLQFSYAAARVMQPHTHCTLSPNSIVSQLATWFVGLHEYSLTAEQLEQKRLKERRKKIVRATQDSGWRMSTRRADGFPGISVTALSQFSLQQNTSSLTLPLLPVPSAVASAAIR